MRLLPVILCLGVATAVQANPVRRPHIEAELIPESTAVAPGQALTVALRLKMEERWHTYWKNPGDSGLPTRIEWKLPPGFEAGPIQWPAPKRIDVGPLANYGYEGEVLLLTDIRTPPSLSGSVPLEAKAHWLVCEEICIPGDAQFSVVLPVGNAAPDPRWANRFRETRAALPREVERLRASATLAGNEWLIALPRTAAPALTRLTFFPEEDGWIRYSSRQRLSFEGGNWRLRLDAAPEARARQGELKGILVAEPELAGGVRAAAVALQFTVVPALPVPAPEQSGAALSLVTALAFAFAGGLLLNLMPCVFPVVSIKVLSFFERAGGDRASLRGHGLLFASGVLVCFWVVAGLLLALRAAGAALGWGYQLQSPVVVSALSALFFALALNLSGVFHFGDSMQRIAGSLRARSGYLDAFLSGLLATVIATPCTAPFMGAALGFALTQPVGDAMLTFTSLALGMAAPYVVLSFSPRLMEKLPRPGPWMETLKQLLAFPLYLTVVWLVWVLGRQTGLDGAIRLLAGLVLLGAALWAFGRFRHAAVYGARRAAFVSAALLFAGGLAIAWPQAPGGRNSASAEGHWQPWSRAALVQAQAAGKAVFVDFTAAWCVTCQVNKRLVLERESVLRHFTERGVVLMRADWTSQDPEITMALKELGRSGVPVYALYPPRAGAPLLLPELLTEARVIAAIDVVTATRTAASQ
ncbi:MAG TPA: thioredoxin family protein [Burkholderiales bacterium]|nr:thioredoxin family protein [Burkholderiales bacterium]